MRKRMRDEKRGREREGGIKGKREGVFRAKRGERENWGIYIYIYI